MSMGAEPDGQADRRLDAPVVSPCRVFVIDDHEVVRAGLHRAAEQRPDEFVVVGEAAGYDEALRRLDAGELAEVDAIVVDLLLPDGDGVTLARELLSRVPRVGCVMHTYVFDLQALLGARLAGASAYVLKGAPTEQLLAAIRSAAAGESLLDDVPIEELLDDVAAGSNGRDAHLDHLTPQERRIFHLIGTGLTNREIGEELHLAEKTVRNYVSNMYTKLDISRRAEAAALAGRIAERARAMRHRSSGMA